MLLVLIYLFVEFAVVALAFTRGGRYERYGALIFLVSSVVFSLTQLVLTGQTRRNALYVIDTGMFLALAWLFWRSRTLWAGALAAPNAVGVLLGVVGRLRVGDPSPDLLMAIWWFNSAMAYGQLLVIALAVLRRDFGPPYPLPRRLSQAAAAASPDTIGAAAGVGAAAAGSTQPSRRASR